MSVHDDGPPRFDRKKDKGVEPAPPMSAATKEDPAKDDQLAEHVKKAAEQLLADYVYKQQTITSLDFKHALRRRTVEMEPTPIISQEDVSRFLKRWFLDQGEKSGYAFREHAALDKDGQPKPGKTVFNEYFYAPGARDAEKEIEAAVEALAAEGKEPEGGIKAFFKKMWSKMR